MLLLVSNVSVLQLNQVREIISVATSVCNLIIFNQTLTNVKRKLTTVIVMPHARTTKGPSIVPVTQDTLEMESLVEVRQRVLAYHLSVLDDTFCVTSETSLKLRADVYLSGVG